MIALFLSPYANTLKGALGIANVSDTRKPEPARAQVNSAPDEKQLVASSNAAAPAPVKTTYKTRVVKKGETLSDLVREVYRVDPKAPLDDSLFKLVKQHNPAITDSNLIIAGSVIQFPVLPRD
jgi:nucleoid-associated protein YgaU